MECLPQFLLHRQDVLAGGFDLVELAARPPDPAWLSGAICLILGDGPALSAASGASSASTLATRHFYQATWPLGQHLAFTSCVAATGRSSGSGNTTIASPVRRAGPSREMQMKPAHHAVAPAWPPTLESYDYLSSLVARDWAWEGLRRNESYQAAALAHAATANVTEHLEGRALARGCRRPPLLHMRGRSAPFADPSLTALQARHVWLPDAGASTLLGVTEPAYASSKRNGKHLPSIPAEPRARPHRCHRPTARRAARQSGFHPAHD